MPLVNFEKMNIIETTLRAKKAVDDLAQGHYFLYIHYLLMKTD